MTQLWLVSYDVVDRQRRRALHELLSNHGERVQFSVFECWLTLARRKVLKRWVSDAIDAGEDSVRWYPLCAWCRNDIDIQGRGKSTEDEGFYIL